MESVVGTIAVVITLIMIIVGITAQILKNYRNKSTAGISLSFFILSFLSWCSWGAYGWIRDDFFMKFAQTFGALMTLIVLFQFYIYRKN